MLKQEQIQEIKELYYLSKKDLWEIELQLEKYSTLDNGLSDSTESFEQGYVNAIENICNILGIEL